MKLTKQEQLEILLDELSEISLEMYDKENEVMELQARLDRKDMQIERLQQKMKDNGNENK